MNKTTARAFFIVAFIGFFASLLVHIASYFCISSYISFILHIGIFVVFIPAMIVIKETILMHKKDENTGWLLEKLFKVIPMWQIALCAFFAFYVFINFAITIGLMESGYGELRHGKYYLMSHNVIIKEITKNKFHWLNAYGSRLASGHWMVFYLFSAIVLWYKSKNTSRDIRSIQ